MENVTNPSMSSDCSSQTLEYNWFENTQDDIDKEGEELPVCAPQPTCDLAAKKIIKLDNDSPITPPVTCLADCEDKMAASYVGHCKSQDDEADLDQDGSHAPVIKTFVFVDLETTGLIDDNKPMPKITEIAMVAVHRTALLSQQDIRIQDKLVLCVDPGTDIHPTASQITQLSNTALRDHEKQKFNVNIVIAVRHFIKRQSPPVCMVAHNGDAFDFKILKDELARLPGKFEDVLCGDTLTAFCALRDREEAKACIEGFPSPKRQKGDLTLKSLYAKYVAAPLLNGHSAEFDAVALMKIVQKKGEVLLEWFDKYALPFNSGQVPYQPPQMRGLITPPMTPQKNKETPSRVLPSGQ